MFLDIVIGYPGSMHNGQVLRNTKQFRKVEIFREPVITLNGTYIRPLLVGDGAYPLIPWLLKPYLNTIALTPSVT